jgi:hypothetical protein
MTDFLTPTVGIIGTHTGSDPNTLTHSYTFTNKNNGATQTTTSTYGPKEMDRLLNVDFGAGGEAGKAAAELQKTLAPIFQKLNTKDQRGYYQRGLAPVLRTIPAYFAGGPWDLASLASYLPAPDELIMLGYEAVTDETPSRLAKARKRSEAHRKEVAEHYGTEATRRRFQKNLRAADDYLEDKLGFRPFEDSVGTDMTPEARGLWEKMLTMGLEFGVGGVPMIKGITIPLKAGQELAKGAQFIFSRLAKKSATELGEAALKPENIRSLIDQAHDAYSISRVQGRQNIRAEVGFGFGAGVSTEAALAGLEKVDPDAAGWVKASVAIGAGLMGPIAARSAITSLLQAPVIRIGARMVVDPLLRPVRAAAIFTQKEGLGTTMADRADVASVGRLLAEAIEDGRHVHAASGLAFTTPELARSEANILRAQVQLKKERLAAETDGTAKERLEQEIETDEANISNLNRYANFQESVLISAAKDQTPGAAARFFDAEAKRLVERREQFFNYIEGTFKKSFDELSFGGKPGGTVQELNFDYMNAKQHGAVPEFENTRRKLVMEADPKGLEPSELRWLNPEVRTRVNNIQEDLSAQMDDVFTQAMNAAEGRVDYWNTSVRSYLAERGIKSVDDLSQAEGKLIGDIIRGTYDDAYREFRAFEKAAYGRIKGLDDKVTENIVFPDGSKDSFGNDISGMTVEDWATNRLDNLSATETFNPGEVPVQLAQLAGMRSVIAQLNRRRKAAVAEGRAGAAESRIPDLERQRDDAITRRRAAEKALDDQLAADRVASEKQTRTLQTFIENAKGKLDDVQRQAVDDFITNPDINWETITPDMARGFAPKGMSGLFSEIAKQKRSVSVLGEGTVSSKQVARLTDEVTALGKRAQEYQSRIDDITSGFLGTLDDKVIIEPTGRLTARNADGELIRSGTSANDVRETISDIAEVARREVAANGKTPRYKSLLDLRQVLEKLLTPETFPTLDPAALSFAREASRLKRKLDDAQANILAKGRRAGVKVEVEEIADIVLPATTVPTIRAAKLRLLEEATADVPDFVTITRGEDGLPVAAINEAAIDGRSLFDLPDSPFEMVSVGQAGTPFEIRLRPNAPVSPRSLKIAEDIILERLALQFPDGVDSKILDDFRTKNGQAIKFLENNGRNRVPEMLNNADDLAETIRVLNNLIRDKTKRQLTELVNSRILDLQGLKVDDYLDYIGQRRRRLAEENAFAGVIKADPGYAAKTLFDRVLDPGNNQPQTSLQEFLSVVRGNKQAENGLKSSIVGQLFALSTTRLDPAASGALFRQTGDPAASAFDPTKFRELIQNPRIRNMLLEVFPDNDALLKGLDDMAAVAFETSNFTRGSPRMAGAVDPQSSLSLEAWSNLGRIAGLQAAERIGFLNSLMAAGMFGRGFKKLGKSITGVKIKDIVVEAALDPRKAVQLADRTANVMDGFWLTFAKGLIDTVNVPGTIAKRPAAAVQTLKRGEEELDQDTRIGPHSSVQPAGPPNRRMVSNLPPPRAPSQASMLSQVNPVGLPPAHGPGSPTTRARGQQLFGANDPIFHAAHGGYVNRKTGDEASGIMSIQCKPRQIVG